MLTSSSDVLLEEDAPRDTFWPCTFNLSKVIMGAGMMAIPKAFQMLGFLAGTAMVFFVGMVTYFTLATIVKASETTGCRSYAAIVHKVCGGFSRSVLQLAIFFNCIGLCVVYLVVIGDVLVGSAPDYNGILCELLGTDPLSTWYLQRKVVLAVLTLTILVPLVSLRSMDKLAIVNIIGVLSVFAFAAATMVLAAAGVRTHQEYSIKIFPDWRAFGSGAMQITMQMAAIIPVILNSNICHMSIHPLVPYLKPFTRQRMNGVMAGALGICNTLYLAIAICTCIVFGADLEADVLNNMNVTEMAPLVGEVAAHMISDTVRIGFAIALIGSFVLLMYPARQVITETFFPRVTSGRTAGDVPARIFYPMTYILVACIYVTAVYVPTIWAALSIVGSTSSTLQGFLFPSLIVLALEKGTSGRHYARRAMAVFTASLGAALFVNGFLVFFFPAAASDEAAPDNVGASWMRLSKAFE